MAEFITLTPDERQRFAVYCRQHAASSRGITEQATSLLATPGGEAWIRREQDSMAAFTAVAEHLEMTQKYSVDGCCREGGE